MITRILFFICLLNTCVFVCSASKYNLKPDTLQNQVDAKGQKQGFWRVFYENGKTRYEANFKNNKPIGEMKRYYDDGTLKAIMIFDVTGKKSSVKLFYNNGILAAEGNYLDSNKDSIWRYFSYYDRTLKMEETYRIGVKNGVTKKYHSNGKNGEILQFRSGMKNGEWKRYFENDTLELQANFENDKRNGRFTTYYPTGKPEVVGFFRDNLREGDWIYFDENGKVMMTIKYVKDIAQNQNVLDKKQEEFFKVLDSNKGKIPEPDETNIFQEKQ